MQHAVINKASLIKALQYDDDDDDYDDNGLESVTFSDTEGSDVAVSYTHLTLPTNREV